MWRHTHRLFVALVLLSGAGSFAPAAAQDAETLRREMEALRQQFATTAAAYERQLKELTQRLDQLENRPPVSSAPAARAAAPPPSAAPSLADLARPRQPFALASPGGLLFDIGVSGDFVADVTSATRERRRDGTFAGRENRVFPREVTLAMFGRVDPFASAAVRISAGEGPGSRDLDVRLDEANITLLTLPLDTTARLGLMRPRFGTLNV